MIRRALLLCAAALFAAPPMAFAQPSSPEEFAAAIARPAIVFVQVNWHGWVRDKRTGEVFGGAAGYEIRASCTGAIISPDGYIATASHCVHTGPLGGSGALFDAAIADLTKVGRIADPAKAKSTFVDNAIAEGATPDSPVDRAIQVERMDGARDVAPAVVTDLVSPTEGDVAILKIPRDRLPSLEIRRDPPPVGTPILAIGYPGSTESATDPNLEPSSKNGQINAHRTQENISFYEFSAAATHGMSGGPVVDTQGKIVGLISQGSPNETQAFNLATAAVNLTNLLKNKDITPTQSPTDRNYRTALTHYFAGDYDSAVEYFDAVLSATPNHPQAASYRQLSVDKGGVPGSNTTLLLSFAIAAAALAVVTAALGTLILTTRRRTQPPPNTPSLGIPLALPPPQADHPQQLP